MNPFDFVNSILQSKKELITDDASEDEYVPFLANRSLSYHNDCIMFANEMNRRHFLDKKLQFDYLLCVVRSKKRPFTKWTKIQTDDNMQCVKTYFKLSDSKAREALRILKSEDIEKIRNLTDVGGTTKK